MSLSSIIKELTPVRLVNRTDNLYIAVMSEEDRSTIVLSPGEWSYRRGLYSIDGFAAYVETDRGMQSVSVKDSRGVASVLWKTSNAFDNGNHSVTKQGNDYVFDRNATPYGDLNVNDQRYFSPLLVYRSMTKNEMLSGNQQANANYNFAVA